KLAWQKLFHCYDLLLYSPLYAAAVAIQPARCISCTQPVWTGDHLRDRILRTHSNIGEYFNKRYQFQQPEEANGPSRILPVDIPNLSN
ncbi:hypothetical protein LZ30DRAFT_610729, partial [Colletotrichum cereale]